MKVAYLIVRYGPEIRGGAEQGCRMLAERLADRKGWSVEVFTTCAIDAGTWADVLAPGTSTVGGVVVHRFASVSGRHPDFETFSETILSAPEAASPASQRQWIDMQGPVCPDAVDAAIASDAELVVLTPYLYWPTVRGAARLGRRGVMHPATHDEAPVRLPVFRDTFEAVAGHVFYTESERRLAQRLFPAITAKQQLVLGLGVEPGPGEPEMFRAGPGTAAGLGEEPYLLCLGRIDDGKGARVLAEFFMAYKRRHPGALKLVFAGPVASPPPPHPDIVMTGAIGDQEKWGALRGATAVVSPSANESFSLVVLEAWAAGVPAVVHGRCPATVEHVRRSGGGLAFSGYASFEVIIERLTADVGLRTTLAQAGGRYVEEQFRWPVLVERYARWMEGVARGSG